MRKSIQWSKSIFCWGMAAAENLPTDLVSIDIRAALYHLGTITGQISNEEILGSIFSKFCIGK